MKNKDAVCSWATCNQEAHTLGLCSTHYQRQRSGSRMDAPLRPAKERVCSVEGCERSHRARGLCDLHYLRRQRGNDLTAPLRGNHGRPCTVSWCDRPMSSKGFCTGHYGRHINGRDMNTPFQTRQLVAGQLCSVESCDRPVKCSGLCNAHYRRRLQGQEVTTPLRGYGVRRRINEQGYVLLWDKSRLGRKGYAYEHRHVMSEILGRPLKRTETVHHINGVRDDNRIENLELWVAGHPGGQRVQDLLAWARKILAEYGPLEDTLFSQAPLRPS